MRPLVAVAVGCGVAVGCVGSSGHGTLQPDNVVRTDGRFDDWAGVTPAVIDSVDASADAAVDFGAVAWQDDPRYVHLAVEVGRPVNLQSMRGTVSLVLDADGDTTTGRRRYEIPGVDLVVDFSLRDRPDAEGFGAGVGLRLPGPDGDRAESGYAVGVQVAPTHSATRFEIRLGRGIRFRGTPVFDADSLRGVLVYHDDAGIGDRTAPFAYGLTTPVETTHQSAAEPRVWRRGAGVTRVVVWNVAGSSFGRRTAAFARVLAALEPDVVMLDELDGNRAAADVDRLVRHRALSASPWRTVLGMGGGRQRAAVITRLPVRAAPPLVRVRYPVDALAGVWPEDDAAGRRREAQAGLSVAGAWVTVAGRDILFVPLDLQSGGAEGSWRDALRTVQARTIRHAIAPLRDRAHAIVVAGDFNLVGSRRPLDTLAHGLGRSGEDLTGLPAYRMGDRSQATWRRWGDRFTPGRLDLMLYSPSVLDVEGFVFDLDAVPRDARRRLGLDGEDLPRISDHLPLVADLRWVGDPP